jgi:exodeoxyribonuclease V beta subunit
MSEILDDPYLSLPLDGVRLIEASAGTGKTFTLATLFTRLVVERELRIGQVLAVTFTEAATQELRKRIRERLALAATLVGQDARAEDGPEIVLTRAILQRHLQESTESPQQLARRLQIAAEETDLAAIFTIHGFCARVLREHALESGHGFDAPELLGNVRDLYEELAADLWRVHAADPADADALTDLWSGPEALAKDLAVLVGDLPLRPEPDAFQLQDPRPLLEAAGARLAAGFIEHGDAYFDDVMAALEADVLNRQSYKPEWIGLLQQQLRQWSRHPQHLEIDERIGKLTFEALSAKTKKAHVGKTPISPLQPLIADVMQEREHLAIWRRHRAQALLHLVRDQARQRLAVLKLQQRVQTYDDLIDGVADALDGPHRQALVAQLRAQYRIALVDEFQDTDARQWRIFERVFGDSEEVRQLGATPALFLIGDPKQAIYGFRGGDVHTYLRTKAQADIAPALDRNFRSRPALLRALDQLYADAGEEAFVEAGIRFEPVQPGTRRSDADYQRNGAPAPALTVRVLRSEDGKPLLAEPSRAEATAACVADIHAVLSETRAGRALIDGTPVQPGDIAVLVRNHKEATRMQRALTAAGIPAVAAGRQSLYATPEAHELRLLLLALLQPSDEGRLRAALATLLLGEDASAIAELENDGERQREHQDRLLHWRERWQRGGPFALVADLCAEQAERLLGLVDGERRLTNYLQLGELMQEAATRTLGLHGLLDWLQLQIAYADDNDEAQLLRLESDAQRVQIVTLHKSKGLEYPLVYLPFVGIGSRAGIKGNHCTIHTGDVRELHWKIDKDEAWEAAGKQAQRAQEAEEARLLYVGLTRAVHALWIATGDLADAGRSRLAPLLSNRDALAAHADVRIIEASAEAPPPRLPAAQDDVPAPPRAITRAVPHDWWVYSFTQLAHADAGHDTSAASTEDSGAATDEPAGGADVSDEEPVATDVFDPRFAGSRFGNVLHKALEDVDFAAWAGWRSGDPAPAGQEQILRDALLGKDGGYEQKDVEDGIARLTSLVGQTLTVTLPEGGALHSLGVHERRAEIEFHFAMQPTTVPTLLALLHAHGVTQQRRGFGLRQRLEGLMTGKIDLTYVRERRWYVLDYKSNRLPSYDAARLAAAMHDSEYDLQALIYTVALHRWLRFRLGADYDYARDFGGVRYLFCRGLDASRDPSPGLYAHRFTPELVHALDALFAGGEAAHARMLARLGGTA